MVTQLVVHFGPTRLDAIQPTQLERFRQKRIADGMKASYINAELKVFKAMLRWASEDMKLPVAKLKVKMLAVDRGYRVKAWSAEEVSRLYAAIQAHSPKLYELVRFMLNTGVRKGEAIAAEWSWVDETKGLLRIPVTEFWKPKDKEPREVPIDHLLPMLYGMARPSSAVFSSPLGTPYAEFPQKTFARVVKLAGLSGATCHAAHVRVALPGQPAGPGTTGQGAGALGDAGDGAVRAHAAGSHGPGSGRGESVDEQHQAEYGTGASGVFVPKDSRRTDRATVPSADTVAPPGSLVRGALSLVIILVILLEHAIHPPFCVVPAIPPG